LQSLSNELRKRAKPFILIMKYRNPLWNIFNKVDV
jgi:hypothetical protein